METIKLLETLKLKINRVINNSMSYRSFDRWLVSECIKNNLPKYYNELVSELMTELEGIQVELMESGNLDESRKAIDQVHFSSDFINRILEKINAKIKELKKN